MAPRKGHAKAGSVASSSGLGDAVNGILPDTATAPRRRRRTHSTSSPLGSPVVVVPKPAGRSDLPTTTRPVDVKQSAFGIGKWLTTIAFSTFLEAGLQTAVSTLGVGDLAAISRRHDSWADILGLLSWKWGKLALYWAAGFDAYDVAALSLLLSTPATVLLGLFYQISPSTLITTTLSSMLSNGLPYYLLRPISPSHNPNTAPRATLRNRPILTDLYTTIATSLLSSAIFAVLLEAAFATYLPRWLVLHFVGLRTLDAVYFGASGLPTLLLALIPAGYAVFSFIFAPAEAAAFPTSTITIDPAVAPMPAFDPATATLWGHVHHNVWGWYSPRQKELVRRTGSLTALLFTEAVVSCWGAVRGVEIQGALLYAAVWAAGCVVTGATLDWVGGPSD